jgi:hypothetical protein
MQKQRFTPGYVDSFDLSSNGTKAKKKSSRTARSMLLKRVEVKSGLAR